MVASRQKMKKNRSGWRIMCRHEEWLFIISINFCDPTFWHIWYKFYRESDFVSFVPPLAAWNWAYLVRFPFGKSKVINVTFKDKKEFFVKKVQLYRDKREKEMILLLSNKKLYVLCLQYIYFSSQFCKLW